LGQVIYSGTLSDAIGKYIDLQNAASGIYYLQVHTDHGIIVKKVIKE
jgi:hypothetical protein